MGGNIIDFVLDLLKKIGLLQNQLDGGIENPKKSQAIAINILDAILVKLDIFCNPKQYKCCKECKEKILDIKAVLVKKPLSKDKLNVQIYLAIVPLIKLVTCILQILLGPLKGLLQ